MFASATIKTFLTYTLSRIQVSPFSKCDNAIFTSSLAVTMPQKFTFYSFWFKVDFGCFMSKCVHIMWKTLEGMHQEKKWEARQASGNRGWKLWVYWKQHCLAIRRSLRCIKKIQFTDSFKPKPTHIKTHKDKKNEVCHFLAQTFANNQVWCFVEN